MSSLTKSHQVYLGQPLCLIQSTFIVIQRLMQSASMLKTSDILIYLLYHQLSLYLRFNGHFPGEPGLDGVH